MSAGKSNFFDRSISELAAWMVQEEQPAFRVGQLLQWVYQKGCLDFFAMSNLHKQVRLRLSEVFTFELPEIKRTQISADGTIKWEIQTQSGVVETVFIPEPARGTLCISSQVGCPVGCRFCATGQQGFQRNLTLGEILGQVLVAQQALAQPIERQQPITNVVFMGMGEPLLNFNAVTAAAELLVSRYAFALARRRVTISTSGVVPALSQLVDRVDVALAVSLHAATDDVRDQLMPINRKYPLSLLVEALKAYYQRSKVAQQGKITLEYTLLKGINDSQEQAILLTKRFAQLPVKFNLIPWNPIANTDYQPTDPEAIEAFKAVLVNAGYVALVRKTRGQDIAAACGQLVGEVRTPKQIRASSLNDARRIFDTSASQAI